MIPSLDVAACTLDLAFEDREETRTFFSDALNQQAFLLKLPERPQDFSTFSVVTRDPRDFELSFQACVVQIYPEEEKFGAVFQILGWNDALESELHRKLNTEEPLPLEEGENLGTAPVFRIKQLDLPQKMQLALKADRGERTILCRDNAPMVLLNLLSNPRLEAENVLAMVKSNFATADILQRVASDRRWMSSAEIRTAVVRNPKTPTPIAVRLLDSLPIGELRDLAKMGSAREDLRQAAFKVYTKLSAHR